MAGILSGGLVIAQFTAPLTLKSNRPVFAADTLSLHRNTNARTAQRWELDTGIEPLLLNANQLMVHLVVNGYSVPIQIYTPQNYAVMKMRTSASTPSVSVAASKGDSSVVVGGNAGLIPSGTFVKFATDNKVYMLTADLNNTGTMQLFPPLRTNLAAGCAVTHRDDVVMTVVYDTDTISGMVYNDGILMSTGNIKLIEKLS